MESPLSPRSPLAEVERMVLEEGREWMRLEMQKRLQQLADAEGKVFPPQPPAVETHAGDNPAA
jgi:hypothetical protein